MLYLNRSQADEVIRHAGEKAPNEACGILAGRPAGQYAGGGRVVERVFRMTNTDESAKTFLMDPAEQLRVMKEIRASGLEMVGIYHSHPETEARPSAHDVSMAFYPGASYVIVSLKDKGDPAVRSFKIVDGLVTEERMHIE